MRVFVCAGALHIRVCMCVCVSVCVCVRGQGAGEWIRDMVYQWRHVARCTCNTTRTWEPVVVAIGALD